MSKGNFLYKPLLSVDEEFLILLLAVSHPEYFMVFAIKYKEW